MGGILALVWVFLIVLTLIAIGLTIVDGHRSRAHMEVLEENLTELGRVVNLNADTQVGLIKHVGRIYSDLQVLKVVSDAHSLLLHLPPIEGSPEFTVFKTEETEGE